MRKWHRWLVVFFGVFLLWIAGTGVAMQVTDLFGEDHDEAPAAQVAKPAPGPAGHKHEKSLHDVIFSFSALWMYVQMWRNRAKRKLKPGWFWK